MPIVPLLPCVLSGSKQCINAVLFVPIFVPRDGKFGIGVNLSGKIQLKRVVKVAFGADVG